MGATWDVGDAGEPQGNEAQGKEVARIQISNPLTSAHTHGSLRMPTSVPPSPLNDPIHVPGQALPGQVRKELGVPRTKGGSTHAWTRGTVCARAAPAAACVWSPGDL